MMATALVMMAMMMHCMEMMLLIRMMTFLKKEFSWSKSIEPIDSLIVRLTLILANFENTGFVQQIHELTLSSIIYAWKTESPR